MRRRLSSRRIASTSTSTRVRWSAARNSAPAARDLTVRPSVQPTNRASDLRGGWMEQPRLADADALARTARGSDPRRTLTAPDVRCPRPCVRASSVERRRNAKGRRRTGTAMRCGARCRRESRYLPPPTDRHFCLVCRRRGGLAWGSGRGVAMAMFACVFACASVHAVGRTQARLGDGTPGRPTYRDTR